MNLVHVNTASKSFEAPPSLAFNATVVNLDPEWIMSILHAPNECVAEDAVTSMSLSVCPGHLLKVDLAAGDRLRVDRGLLWYTVEGRLDDCILEPGQSETLTEALTLSVTGFHKTEFVVTSAQPYPRFVRPGGVRPYASRRRWGVGFSAAARWMRSGARALYGRRVAG